MIGESWIEYNGDRYRLAFTMLQLQHNFELAEEKKEAIAKTIGVLTATACTFYSAYIMACRQDRVKPVLSFDDMEMIVDYLFTNDKEQYNRIDADFTASNAYKDTYGKVSDDEKKRLILIAQEPLQPAV